MFTVFLNDLRTCLSRGKVRKTPMICSCRSLCESRRGLHHELAHPPSAPQPGCPENVNKIRECRRSSPQYTVEPCAHSCHDKQDQERDHRLRRSLAPTKNGDIGDLLHNTHTHTNASEPEPAHGSYRHRCHLTTLVTMDGGIAAG